MCEHPSALHQEFEFCGTREFSSKHHRLVTLGSCRSLDGLEKVILWSPSRRLWRCTDLVVRGSCVDLAGVVKRNSSGIEVWRSSLINAGSRSREVLIEEQLIL